MNHCLGCEDEQTECVMQTLLLYTNLAYLGDLQYLLRPHGQLVIATVMCGIEIHEYKDLYPTTIHWLF